MSDGKNVVYLLGDSITQGLGSKKVNFTGELSRLLGESYVVVNLAYTGTMVDYALQLLEDDKVRFAREGDVCVLLYGNVDAQIRPSHTGRVFPRIPKRFQGGGMLMPRPFYSRSLAKRMGQHVDNLCRKVLSGIIKLVDGTEQWMPLESFSLQYEELLDRLLDLGFKVIPCSCVYINEKMFPGTPEQYELYNQRINSLASERSLQLIDFYGMFKSQVEASGWDSCYNKDHFHPNGEGYRLMADRIAAQIKSTDH
ncbi:MAG: SGNH/GDSL hydrolase family protein [Collinsella aerofaciens]